MKKNFKTIGRDALILFNPFYRARKGKRILCFHDIQDGVAFEKRIKWLSDRFTILSLDELLEQGREESGLALTFDDAYESWETIVLPILKKHQIPATFFINSGLLDLQGEDMEKYFKQNCKRDNQSIRALSTEGLNKIVTDPLFEIGGHTRDHFLFSAVTSPKDLEVQIGEDKQTLELHTGRQLKYFAYPFGQLIHASQHVQDAVRDAGYKNAFTIIPGYVEAANNPYLIHRDSLELFQSKSVWNRWLHGGYDVLIRAKLHLYQLLAFKYR